MSTFLIRSATSQSSSYPVVLTRLGGVLVRKLIIQTFCLLVWFSIILYFHYKTTFVMFSIQLSKKRNRSTKLHEIPSILWNRQLTNWLEYNSASSLVTLRSLKKSPNNERINIQLYTFYKDVYKCQLLRWTVFRCLHLSVNIFGRKYDLNCIHLFEKIM